MVRFTLTEASVQHRNSGALLPKADVTRNGVDDRAMLKRFGLFGPPAPLSSIEMARRLTAPASSASRAPLALRRPCARRGR